MPRANDRSAVASSGRSAATAARRRSMPPASTLRKSSRQSRKTRDPSVADSPASSVPIRATTWAGLTALTASSSWSGVHVEARQAAGQRREQVVGPVGVLRQERGQLGERHDDDDDERRQHPEREEDQDQRGQPRRPVVAAQPGLDRVQRDDDHEREECRADQPCGRADPREHEDGGTCAQQHDQRPRDDVEPTLPPGRRRVGRRGRTRVRRNCRRGGRESGGRHRCRHAATVGGPPAPGLTPSWWKRRRSAAGFTPAG